MVCSPGLAAVLCQRSCARLGAQVAVQQSCGPGTGAVVAVPKEPTSCPGLLPALLLPAILGHKPCRDKASPWSVTPFHILC